MELAPAGVPLSFEVTFDRSDLHVGMSVYDDSGASPVLLLSPFAMAWVAGYTYRGKFTAENGKSYIIIKAVYTTSDLNVLSPDYSQGSESIVTQYISSNNEAPAPVVGIVDEDEAVVGLVDENDPILGQVDC